MHTNYYFLRQLSAVLNTALTGSVVSECFSQHKDELIVRFETPSGLFFIKASLQPEFCCLSFPGDFKRARKNSIDLFTHIIGLRVTGVRQFLNERSFAIELERAAGLFFKMHGNRANIILFENKKAIAIFRNHLKTDFTIRPDEADKHIDFSRKAFTANLHNLPAHYFTFGKTVWHYLDGHNFSEKSEEEKWNLFLLVINLLEKPSYYITELSGQLTFSLLPTDNIRAQFTDPVEAINAFFTQFVTTTAWQTERSRALNALQSQLKLTINYIRNSESKRNRLNRDTYRLWADLIMANLQSINRGTEQVVLTDFHTNEQHAIKLKKELSAQKNAELYYRKSRNRALELERLSGNIAARHKDLARIQQCIDDLMLAKTKDEVKRILNAATLRDKKPAEKTSLPYNEVQFQGFKIWIGKNARGNDELTFRCSFKEDLWLHARDVAGSHVLIKYQAGKPFPKAVIERAAQLAAFNSKRKTDTLCPVTVTSKKYVRKRKGDAPGSVMVEKERVILVEPNN